MEFNEWLMTDEAMKVGVARSDYQLQLSFYEPLFSRIHIEFYEDYAADYRPSLKRIFTFLDLDPAVTDRIPNEMINTTSEASVPRPVISTQSREFLRDTIGESSRAFLKRFDKPQNFWPSIA